MIPNHSNQNETIKSAKYILTNKKLLEMRFLHNDRTKNYKICIFQNFNFKVFKNRYSCKGIFRCKYGRNPTEPRTHIFTIVNPI